MYRKLQILLCWITSFNLHIMSIIYTMSPLIIFISITIKRAIYLHFVIFLTIGVVFLITMQCMGN